MIALFIALATAGQAAATLPAPSPATTGRALRDIPGIAITYHDLAEKDVKAISNAIAKKKALTPAQLTLLSASTKWGISPSVTKATTGNVCTVTKAQTDFTAAADLPRFNEASVTPANLPAWRGFLAATEAEAAAKLWYTYDHLQDFQQAVIGKPCAQAMTDGAAAIAKLKADSAAFKPEVAAPAPQPAAAATPADGKASAK